MGILKLEVTEAANQLFNSVLKHTNYQEDPEKAKWKKRARDRLREGRKKEKNSNRKVTDKIDFAYENLNHKTH